MMLGIKIKCIIWVQQSILFKMKINYFQVLRSLFSEPKDPYNCSLPPKYSLQKFNYKTK